MPNINTLDYYSLLLTASFLIPLIVTIIGWERKSSAPLRVLLGIAIYLGVISLLITLTIWLVSSHPSSTSVIVIAFLVTLVISILRSRSAIVVVNDKEAQKDGSSFLLVLIVFAIIIYFVFSKSLDAQTEKIKASILINETNPLSKIDYFEVFIPLSVFCLILVIFTWAMLYMYERYTTKSSETALFLTKNENSSKSEILSNIQNGRVEEAVDALILMAQQFKNKEVIDTCILLRSKLNLVKQEQVRGTISPEDYRSQILRIGESVINIVKSLPFG